MEGQVPCFPKLTATHHTHTHTQTRSNTKYDVVEGYFTTHTLSLNLRGFYSFMLQSFIHNYLLIQDGYDIKLRNKSEIDNRRKNKTNFKIIWKFWCPSPTSDLMSKPFLCLVRLILTLHISILINTHLVLWVIMSTFEDQLLISGSQPCAVILSRYFLMGLWDC